MANNPIIKSKREDLLGFIKDQLLGPGACSDHFGCDDPQVQGEIINSTPGSLYCTGILFPTKTGVDAVQEDDLNSHDNGENHSMTDDSLGDDYTATVNESSEQSENLNDEEDSGDDESLQTNQLYPQSFGISVCLGKPELSPSDIIIRVSGRYYRKIDDKQAKNVFVNVDQQDVALVTALSKATVSQGEYNDDMSHYFIMDGAHLKIASYNQSLYGPAKKCIDAVDQVECTQIGSHESLSSPIFSNLKGRKFLVAYKESLFIRLRSKSTTDQEANSIKTIINQLEEKEKLLSYFRDLISLLDREDYGFWYSQDFCKDVDLSSLDFALGDKRKKSLLYSDYPSLSHVVEFPFTEKSTDKKKGAISRQASLSICLQLTKDSRNINNKGTYIKVQLLNTSDEFKETPQNYYSIVTEGVNTRAFFGAKIEVISKYLAPYTYRGIESIDEVDQEARKLNYVYRSIEDYGVGHLCSVDWDCKEINKRVWSEFLPSYDIPDIDSTPKLVSIKNGTETISDAINDTSALRIKWLSTLEPSVTKGQIIQELHVFADAYRDWITQTLDDPDNKELSKEIHDECLADYKRMSENIDLLNTDRNMLVFRLMNTAMFIQMWHSKEPNRQKFHNYRENNNQPTKEAYYQGLPDDIFQSGIPASWRPFQLAFILLNIDGIIQRPDDPEWKRRNKLVDLVWFPTGGGKTEAYLGIIALTILYRRIVNSSSRDEGAGTTAIMRYTLRLLTTQQFQRATRLILALEIMRRWDSYPLGKLDENEISIGLFVGNDALPNNLTGDDSLQTEVEKWEDGKDSKIPLNKCPWCGGELEWDDSQHAFYCSCCDFQNRLPILLCDELVYEKRPTLLFGTVDKFAMIAHKVDSAGDADSRRLFMPPSGKLTPDLIIQDELHLMQGTLGSAVGLFECAIDALCTREVRSTNGRIIMVHPKVVSSTATTRNTAIQVKALYNRTVNIFPKNGINYDDSFFAFYKRGKDNSRRRYVGIMPTGRTSMFVQVRLAACCFVHRAIFEFKNSALLVPTHKDYKDFVNASDYYYSLISYFNSLKEVGTTDVQFLTEFTKYTRRLYRRILRPTQMLQCFYTYDRSMHKVELTGRLDGASVVKTLEKVQVPWNPEKRLPYDDQGVRMPLETPPDFILATNMISVGIDVSRFNLMMINSMPRNKAEYIQASSRVARDELGVVFTIHNAFRARDVSHFERFKEFHEKLYYYVEPISITPFSSKSIEKYLPLVIGAIVRHKIKGLAKNKEAEKLTDAKIQEIITFFETYFKPRIPGTGNPSSSVDEVFTQESYNNIIAFVKKALDEWKVKNKKVYSGKKDNLYTSTDAYEEDKASTVWVVPKSLRVVPAGSVIKVDNQK